MRPKKKILLIDTNEDRQGINRFVLEQHAFDVRSANTLAKARKIATAMQIEVIVGYWPVPDAEVWKIAHQNNAKFLLIYDDKRPTQPGQSDVKLIDPPMIDIVEYIKTLAARKRGPVKGSTRKPVMHEVTKGAKAA